MANGSIFFFFFSLLRERFQKHQAIPAGETNQHQVNRPPVPCKSDLCVRRANVSHRRFNMVVKACLKMNSCSIIHSVRLHVWHMDRFVLARPSKTTQINDINEERSIRKRIANHIKNERSLNDVKRFSKHGQGVCGFIVISRLDVDGTGLTETSSTSVYKWHNDVDSSGT